MEDKIIIILISTLTTCFISGIFGMAGGILLKIILANILPAVDAIGTHAFIQVQSNGIRSIIGLKNILWEKIVYFSLGLFVVAIFFKSINFQPNRQIILLLSGGVPLFFTLFRLQKYKWFPRFETKTGGFIAGLCLGLISLLGGVGGPLLDAFFRGEYWKKEMTVSNKAVTQVISHLARLLFYGDIIWQTGHSAYYLWMFLCIISGNVIGQIVLKKLSEKSFRKWTEVLVITLSIIALSQI